MFRHRPSSIVTAVALNEIGPVLPQAMRLLYITTGPFYIPQILSEDIIIDGRELPKYPKTRDQGAILSKNARVVRVLEGFFSRRLSSHLTQHVVQLNAP